MTHPRTVPFETISGTDTPSATDARVGPGGRRRVVGASVDRRRGGVDPLLGRPAVPITGA
jgi:hypothetical protein